MVATAEPSGPAAARSCDSSSPGVGDGVVTSHSSGPSQITVAVGPVAERDGPGSPVTPSPAATRAAAGPKGVARRQAWARNGSAASRTPSGSAANRPDQDRNGWARSSVSAVTAGSLRVDRNLGAQGGSRSSELAGEVRVERVGGGERRHPASQPGEVSVVGRGPQCARDHVGGLGERGGAEAAGGQGRGADPESGADYRRAGGERHCG